MSIRAETKEFGVTRFRVKLLLGIMVVISAMMAVAFYFLQHRVDAEVEQDFQRHFHAELEALHRIQDLRHAMLAERCRTLARKPRIQAALEDDALDLLYPSARDELRDVMAGEDDQILKSGTYALRARFYRFLDAEGAVISPPNPHEVGRLSADAEAKLALREGIHEQHLGYLLRTGTDGEAILDELLAMPIVSGETGEVIASIVLGFKTANLGVHHGHEEVMSGVWLNGRLHFPELHESALAALTTEVTKAIGRTDNPESSFQVEIAGLPHLLFYKRLNPGSSFTPAYEVSIHSLAESLARQRQLRWQVAAGGILLLLGGLSGSHFISKRLSAPIEKLAVDSVKDRARRASAEAALELRNKELQRSARFSADTSHQLKTPVSVLRAGLEELLSREHLPPDVRGEISALIHQTFRLTSVIEDLLLLSRMDAGRLQLHFGAVDLTSLVEALMDDLGAFPDSEDLVIEPDIPQALRIAGEKRYTSIILQNLLENARKYNRRGGCIRITAREERRGVRLRVGNTGRGISAEAREHIFERFHRGSIGEDVPGHGLGLNLARELALLHGGDLRLVEADEDWTEFEVCFRLAEETAMQPLEVA